MEPSRNLKDSNLGDADLKVQKTKSIFHSVKFYVLCQGLINLSYLVLGAYLKSVITTIEKRFQISSTKAGLIASGFEIGNLLVIIPISYLGSRVHRPRAIAIGSIVMMAGGILLAVPHWIFDLYDPVIAHTSSTKGEAIFFDNLCREANETEAASNVTSTTGDSDDTPGIPSNIWGFMFFARMLVGIGAAPIQPYGISYMDDHATRSMAPMYMGILLSVTMVGPAFGYILGSGTTKLYVDFDRIDGEVNLKPTDPGWIGAWWLGFLIASLIMLIAHIPFWFFPKKMEDKSKILAESRNSFLNLQDPDLSTSSSSSSPSPMATKTVLDTKATIESRATFAFYLRDFVSATLRLLRNTVFILLILSYATLMAISAGFAVFLPKFFEIQFGLSASKSNMYIGGVQMPFGLLGVIGGGYMMRKFRLGDRNAIAMSVVASVLSLIVGVPLIFVGCQTRPIAGLTTILETMTTKSTGSTPSFVSNLTVCLDDCRCDESKYEPVCAEGVEYLTPCHAGCRSVEYESLNDSASASVKVLSFSRCSCLPNATVTAQPHACSHQCEHKLWTGIGISCVVLFVICVVQSPIYIVLLRSVSVQDKSFAIGIQFLIMRTLGWLPAPIYFGSTIDASCILWESLGAEKGACRVYDNVDLRKRYLGLICGLQSLCVFFLGALLFFLLRRKNSDENGKVERKLEEFERNANYGSQVIQ